MNQIVTGKVALVTGANRGLGLEISRQLASAGVEVIVTARTEAQATSAAQDITASSGKALPLKLEIGNESDYSNAASFIEKRYGRLDILINNAGADGDAGANRNTTSTASLQHLRETFEVNFFGVVALTQVLLPLIRRSEAGRIINLAAVLGSLTIQSQSSDPFMKSFVYNSSKTALNAFTVHLADELSETPIKVFSAHPGWVKTDHGTSAAELEIDEGARTPVELALSGGEFASGSFLHQGKPLPW